MKIDFRFDLPQWLILAAMYLAAVLFWPYAPEQMPIHWDIHGNVDGYGGRFMGLWFVPLLSTGLYVLFLFLPMLDPGRKNYDTFSTVYHWIRLLLLVFMGAIYCLTVLAAFGYNVRMDMSMQIGIGILFLFLGNVMGKIRPNWFVGVRTPWTLSSKLSWTKTHRLAGWLFMAMGVGWITSGIVRSPPLFMTILGFCAASVLWIFVYSYVVYRRDPDRMTPAGTSPSPE